MKTQDKTVEIVGSTPAEKLIAAALAWEDAPCAADAALGADDALLAAIDAYRAAPPDPWAKLLADTRAEIERIRDDGFCDDAASAVGAMIGAADSARDARHSSPEERAAALETVARGLLALRALDQERSR